MSDVVATGHFRMEAPSLPDVVEFTRFDPATGRILSHGQCRRKNLQLQSFGAIVLEGAFDDALFYWRDNAILDRPVLAVDSTSGQVGATALRLAAVPRGTTVFINAGDRSRSATIDDGEFEFATDFAGRHVFRFEPPFPWQPLRLELDIR